MLGESKLSEHLFLSPKVPQGLAAAVEGLTREVIRHRPENIYSFAAHHFEKLLRLREQYDVNCDTGNDKQRTTKNNSQRVLRDIDQAIREQRPAGPHRHRHSCAEAARHRQQCPTSGWSLNETAKVLERHRSIFGDTGQKISTEQVRELANRSDSIMSGLPRSKKTTGRQRSASLENNVGCQKLRGSEESSPSSPPKIMSQIPLTKDIKTELKKHRRSNKTTVDEKRPVHVSSGSGTDGKRRTTERTTMTTTTTTRRTMSTEESTTKRSLEIVRSERQCRRSSSSRSTESVSISKKRTDIVIGNSPSSSSSSSSSSSRSSLPAAHPIKLPSASSRPSGMDRARNQAVQGLAGMSSLEELQSPSYVEKVQEVINETSAIIKEKVEALKSDFARATAKQRPSPEGHPRASSSAPLSRQSSRNAPTKPLLVEGDPEPKISLPAVKPPSAKSSSSSSSSSSRSASARGALDGLVLPPISPESAKSAKTKADELVLPALSPPQSSPVTPDSLNSDIGPKNHLSAKLNGAEEEEEVFHDSLNVTPDPLVDHDDEQRPDSLEPPETLKAKLLEIQDAQKRIEGVLLQEDCRAGSGMQDKLLEIQESEKRIERILDGQAVAVATDGDGIRRKLEELEDAGRRIETIIDAKNEEVGATATRIGAPREVEEPGGNKDAGVEGGNADDENRGIPVPKVERSKLEEDEGRGKSEDARLVLSPHSYILTEGSPYEIPDNVTTVIIPDRAPSPGSETSLSQMQLEEDERVYATLVSSSSPQPMTERSMHESSGVDGNAVRARQDLGLIREETAPDSEDEEVLKVVTSSLEEILGNGRNEVEYVQPTESMGDSDRSSAVFDQLSLPIVPELNLDSLPDLTVSSLEADHWRDSGCNNALGELVDSERTKCSSASVAEELSGRGGSAVAKSRVVGDRDSEKIGETLDEKSCVGNEEQSLDSALEAGETTVAKNYVEESRATVTTTSNRLVVDEKVTATSATNKAVVAKAQEREGVNSSVVNVSEQTIKTTTETTLRMENNDSERSANLESPASKSEEPRVEEEKEEEEVTSRGSGNENNEDEGKGVIDDANDRNTEQLAEDHRICRRCSSSGSCQCTEEQQQLDSIDPSIETNDADRAQENPSEETDVGREESRGDERRRKIERQATYDKSSDDGVDNAAGTPENLAASSSSSSSFLSAVTKIQAGIRGFLTRRRLVSSTQARSSTLNSVPSIQESEPTVEQLDEDVATVKTDSARSGRSDASILDLLTVVGLTKSVSDLQKKSRQRLTRESALVQDSATTPGVPLEKPFVEGNIQHTGEFHDCIALPIFDLGLKVAPAIGANDAKGATSSDTDSQEPLGPKPSVEQLLSKILLGPMVAPARPFVDVVLLPGDAQTMMLQSSYLNFITSVEDVFNEASAGPSSPKGAVIEEITSLDEEGLKATGESSNSGRSDETPVASEAAESSDDLLSDERRKVDSSHTPKNNINECGGMLRSVAKKEEEEEEEVKSSKAASDARPFGDGSTEGAVTQVGRDDSKSGGKATSTRETEEQSELRQASEKTTDES